jgi:hypothetical protein
MLSLILSLIGGAGGLAGLARSIADAYRARETAANDADRIEADVRIKTLEARRDLLLAEARTPFNQLMRALYGVPPGVYLAKLYLWDKLLGCGTTDPLSPVMEQVLWTVVGFLFLQETVARLPRRAP